MKTVTDILSEAKKQPKKQTVVCPHCNQSFKIEPAQADDRLNQIKLHKDGAPFIKMAWPIDFMTVDGHMIEKHKYWLRLLLSYDPNNEKITSRWMLSIADLSAKSYTPHSTSTLQNKKKLPVVSLKTDSAMRAKLVKPADAKKLIKTLLKKVMLGMRKAVASGIYNLAQTAPVFY
jgi:hypothetical protein